MCSIDSPTCRHGWALFSPEICPSCEREAVSDETAAVASAAAALDDRFARPTACADCPSPRSCLSTGKCLRPLDDSFAIHPRPWAIRDAGCLVDVRKVGKTIAALVNADDGRQPVGDPHECWIQTLTGRQFFPLAPRVEDIAIDDIAGALSKLCRFGGHCTRFYSVAEHSVHVASQAPAEHKLAALLHDASEAYLVDIPSPIKPHLTNYRAIEDRLGAAIAEKFGFAWPLPAEIKRLDTAILSDERAQSMADIGVAPRLWGDPLPGLGVELRFWPPEEAQWWFETAFLRYSGVRAAA